MTTLWCNGKWIEGGALPVAAMDRGAIHGLGVFETILVVEGEPKFVELHWERLDQSCGRLGWTTPSDWREAIREMPKRAGLSRGRARIRLAVTAGSGALDDLSQGTDRLVWMNILPIQPAPEEITVQLSPWRRNERSPLAGLKCASYAENLLALDRARRSGFQETLFLNTAGLVCESATANVFLVRGGKILTPSLASGCLPGVGRQLAFRLAREIGISCEEAELDSRDLVSAEEIFLMSAIRGPTAVSRLGERWFPPGPVTRRMRALWTDEICHG